MSETRCPKQVSPIRLPKGQDLNLNGCPEQNTIPLEQQRFFYCSLDDQGGRVNRRSTLSHRLLTSRIKKNFLAAVLEHFVTANGIYNVVRILWHRAIGRVLSARNFFKICFLFIARFLMLGFYCSVFIARFLIL